MVQRVPGRRGRNESVDEAWPDRSTWPMERELLHRQLCWLLQAVDAALLSELFGRGYEIGDLFQVCQQELLSMRTQWGDTSDRLQSRVARQALLRLRRDERREKRREIRLPKPFGYWRRGSARRPVWPWKDYGRCNADAPTEEIRL